LADSSGIGQEGAGGLALAQRDLHAVGDERDDRARLGFRKFQAQSAVEHEADSPPIGGIRFEQRHTPASAHQIREVRRGGGAAGGLPVPRRLVTFAAPQRGEKPMDHQM
jgi:hypothetical protein